MGILEERNAAKNEVRNEFMRARSRVDNEIRRRVSSGFSRLRAIAEIALELESRNYTVLRSPPPPGSTRHRLPSVETIRRIVEDLYLQTLALRYGTSRPSIQSRPSVSSRPPVSSRAPISPIISPAQRRSNPAVNLGNAVRNLGSAFGLRSPDYRRDEREAQNSRDETEARDRGSEREALNQRDEGEAQNRRSWRDESYNNLILMAEVAETRRRNTVERARAANHLPPVVDDDIQENHYNPNNFRPWKLTLHQAATVMLTFDYELHYKKIKNTFLQYSIKICGMEPCTGDELHIAVYLLIEKYFKFRPVIELCARPVEDPADPSAVGVLFERIESALRIFNNRRVLSNTRYRVGRNLAIDWIIWNYLA